MDKTDLDLIKRVSNEIFYSGQQELPMDKFVCNKGDIILNINAKMMDKMMFVVSDGLLLSDALKISKEWMPIFDPKILEGLKNGNLKLNKSGGNVLGQVVTTDGHKIITNLKFEQGESMKNLGNFGNLIGQLGLQLQLAEIKAIVTGIDEKVGKLSENQYEHDILSCAKSCLRKFDDMRKRPEYEMSKGQVVSSADDAIDLLICGIKERVKDLKNVKEKASKLFGHKKAEEDAARWVDQIFECTVYLYLMYAIKASLAKKYEIDLFNQLVKEMRELFSEDDLIRIRAWDSNEYRREKFFWCREIPQKIRDLEIQNKILEIKNRDLSIQGDGNDKMQKL